MNHIVKSGGKLRILAFIVVFALTWNNKQSRAESFTKGNDVAPFSDLKNGDYIWRPQISPTGPVVIIVSIPQQHLFVYRNGIRIGSSTASTGKKGHSTPTGVFTILQKQVEHYSSIYKGASMPYMQRLTWDGIALHAGKLPGYAASHGCVRLPYDFAQKLYTVTSKGATVIVTDENSTPAISGRPGYLLTSSSKTSPNALAAPGDYQWHPDKSPTGPVSIVFSTMSARVYVFRNGIEIGRAVVRGGEDLRTGTHAYTALDELGSDGRREWSVIDTIGDESAPDLRDLASHLSIAPDFLAQVRAVVVPGTTLIVSDAPVDRSQPLESNVNILSTDTKKGS